MEFLPSRERGVFAIVEPEILKQLPFGWEKLPKTLKKKIFDGCREKRWVFPRFCCSSVEVTLGMSLEEGNVKSSLVVVYFDMFISGDSKSFLSLESLEKELGEIKKYIQEEEDVEKFERWYEKIF
ncbi:hypothetical protein MEL_337 [Melbournevirus]|uniref:hypothetical protein n=1 Tax=Melbournevirus TaxID=1560514 RepID=UPI00051F5579|nr:hypothetical protein MEL_337 [Melbournevirus]AIT54950.1 hypothetical protein MEL_337 [Melbournevirus]